MPDRLASKVLLVGWDAADWDTIDPLMAAGLMPSLASLVARGVRGNLATLDPPFSPMLWTSIATGHTADRHGILHFTQPRSDGQGVRPVLGSSRKTKALWNILSQSGMHSNVVGWWPSHPAEPIRGAMVSDLFHKATAAVHKGWPLPAGAVHPPELADTLAALRIHPAELTASHLLPFLPRLGEMDQSTDNRPTRVAKVIADAASVHAAATYLIETTEWDLTAVYYDAIDHLGHVFMKYHPPRMDHVSEHDFALYRDVVAAGYRFHDMMLGRLLELAGDDTTVVLLSDHGFHSGSLRPVHIPRIPGGPAIEHRQYGVLCMAGPGIRQNERVFGAGLLNIAPTVLTLLGLPVGADMAAPPLVQAFETPSPAETVPSWEDVPGDAGQHDRDALLDPWAEQEALRQLVELGYIDAPGDDAAQAAEEARLHGGFNLGRVYFSTGRAELAVPLFEQMAAAESEHASYYGLWLAQAYAAAGDLDRAWAQVERLRALREPTTAALDLLTADLLIARGDVDAALDLLTDEARPQTIDSWLRRGEILLRQTYSDDAEEAFRHALSLDPDDARAHHGLAKVHIQRHEYQQAASAAFTTIGRLYFYPEAHFHLGIAMLRLGWAERAAQAFTVALQQQPSLVPARRWLARVYREYLRQPDLAEQILAAAPDAAEQS